MNLHNFKLHVKVLLPQIMIESIFVLNGDRKSESKNGQQALAANEVYVGETVGAERGAPIPPDRLGTLIPDRVRVGYVTQEQENDDPNGGNFQRKRPRLDLQQNNQTFETQVRIHPIIFQFAQNSVQLKGVNCIWDR